MSPGAATSLAALNRRITACRACPRLITWCEQVAREKRAAYSEQDYWGKPVPSFGDARARLLIAGLAPGAHGANRTGRMFTGDRSGLWLFRSLHRAGFANQPTYESCGDGLRLRDAYITAVVHCAPPGNRPSPAERDRCLPYFGEELDALQRLQVILALGSFAWDGVLRALSGRGQTIRPKPRFGHGTEVTLGPYLLIGSFHPSQQNTFTGRLTEAMLDRVMARIQSILTS